MFDSVFRVCSHNQPSFKMILLRLGPAGVDPETPLRSIIFVGFLSCLAAFFLPPPLEDGFVLEAMEFRDAGAGHMALVWLRTFHAHFKSRDRGQDSTWLRIVYTTYRMQTCNFVGVI